MDQVHPRFPNTVSECVRNTRLCVEVYKSPSISQSKLRDLRDRVVGELANSALCAQLENSSTDLGDTCRNPVLWCVSSGNAAALADERVEIGVFGNFRLEVAVKPEDGEVW